MPLLIPYWAPKVYYLGPIPIDPWATLACVAFIVGLEIARARGLRLGQEPRDVVDAVVVIVGSGFVVGHLVHVLAYNPHLIEEEGWLTLLKVWGGLSSNGGFLGAILGSIVYYKVVRKIAYFDYADNIMFAFPFAWVFARAGCGVVHDHIGRPSDFFLAVDFPGGPRHDLGIYEALWVLVIALIFWRLDKKPRPGGFYMATWAMLYAPIRFLFDFLRNTDLDGADVRWSGLTPAQYGSILMFVGGVLVIVYLRRREAVAAVPPG